MALVETVTPQFLALYQSYNQERLLAEGYLLPHVPAKGDTPIAAEHRTDQTLSLQVAQR